VPLEVVFVKQFQSQYPIEFWRRHFRDLPLVTWV